MKKRLLYLFFTLASFYSGNQYAQNSHDPISTMQFRNEPLDQTLESLIVNNIIGEETEFSEYPYNLPTDSINVPLDVRFNPDGFEVNTFRQLKIYLYGDTIYRPQPFFLKGSGPMSKKLGDHILSTYQKWYGQYDTIVYPSKPKLPEDLKKMIDRGRAYSQRDWSEEEKEKWQKNRDRTYVWYEQDYNIEFYLPEYEDNEYTGNIPSYKGASITYSITNYKKELKKIKDSIRKGMKAKDIVEIALDGPIWEEDQSFTIFSFRIKDIYRTKLASQVGGFKDITALKYDIIVKNLFDEVLARFEDAIFELPTPMGESVGGYNYHNVGGALTYGNGYEKSDEYNAAKIFANSNTVKLVADIKAIVLGDGQIIK
ncbi:hypothetical protein [Salinimicrobium flavum]|uniref:Uncharacterized protein n=1 Tax=Salinimicrobium flavum TaxID=1737065 RepID=A0ABW5IUD8_9FLAO